MKKAVVIIALLCLMIVGMSNRQLSAQYDELPESSTFQEPNTLLWLGTYSTIRISEKWFWVAQHHYRRINHNDVPYVGRMSQIYNRHALTYKVSDDFLVTLGPVLRLNFTPDPGNDDYRNITLEPRIWHQYVFPWRTFIFDRQVVLQHRIRIEHRWSRSNFKDSDYIYRDRWRYRITAKLPLNRKTLQPNTFYATPLNVEIIMQSGKAIHGSPMEDLRIYPSVGYIFNTKLAISIGMMYTTGQNIDMPYNYSQRWIFRPNIWWTPDFRKFEDKIPEINIMD